MRVSGVAELATGDPAHVALENARAKARAVCQDGAREAVLGCDTLVSLDGEIYGKPADAAEARATLRALSGRTHLVMSGVAVLVEQQERSALATTEVTFRPLDETMLAWYTATGEWRGRAGGYAIQGAGAALVREIRGDYENVVGLPLARLLEIYPELLVGLHR